MKILKRILFFFVIPVLYVVLSLKTLFKSKKYRGGELQPGIWYELCPKALRNAKGAPSPFYARKGTENKLLVWFCGGGVSWSEKSAAKPMTIPQMMLGTVTYYTPKVYGFMRVFFTGILSRKAENPFRDWNVVFIPYVTGDFHLGNNAFPYGPKKTLYHVGEPNTRCIMEECKKLFPETEALFVAGDSAGAFGAAGNAPLVAGYYPNAPVTVYSDASQLLLPLWKRVAEEVWGVNEKMRAHIDEIGDLYGNLIEYSAGELGERAVFLRSNTIHDDVLTQFGSTLRGGPHEATPEAIQYYYESLRDSEKRLADSGLPYYSFITAHNKNPKTGLTQHTMSRAETAYYYKDDVGIALGQWLIDAADGNYQSCTIDLEEDIA